MVGKEGGIRGSNRYRQITKEIFKEMYRPGATHVDFKREDIGRVASRLKLELPKNLGDLIHTFRYRGSLPDSILEKAPKDHHLDDCSHGAVKLSV